MQYLLSANGKSWSDVRKTVYFICKLDSNDAYQWAVAFSALLYSCRTLENFPINKIDSFAHLWGSKAYCNRIIMCQYMRKVSTKLRSFTNWPISHALMIMNSLSSSIYIFQLVSSANWSDKINRRLFKTLKCILHGHGVY